MAAYTGKRSPALLPYGPGCASMRQPHTGMRSHSKGANALQRASELSAPSSWSCGRLGWMPSSRPTARCS
eukprot:175322-Prymnesium_polylepis.2